VDGPEAVQSAAMLQERIADLRDVLVERAAPDVGVHAPDRVDEAVAADDDARVGVEVVEDADLLAAELATLAGAEDQFESFGVDLGAVETEDVGREVGVAREPAVAGRLAAAQHGVDACDELFLMVRLADEIVGAGLEGFHDRLRGFLPRQHDHRGAGPRLPQPFEDREPIEVGQGRVEQHQVDMVLLDELQRRRPFMERLRGETGVFQLLVQGGGQAALVFNDNDERSLLRTHADRRGKTLGVPQRGVCGGGAYRCKNHRKVAKPFRVLFIEIQMTDSVQTEKPTPKWLILLCLVIFIGSAALGGYALAKGAEEKATRKSADPFADRSLFGR
jgi:hypothetical protein